MGKKVLIAGASGMVGSELLALCIKDSSVASIISLVRKPSSNIDSKVEEVVVADFGNVDIPADILSSIDVAYFCIGVYTGAVPREDFRKITIDYPLALAQALYNVNKHCTYCLLSGQGADRTEQSKLPFAKDKGIAENRLSAMGLAAFYTFRPGYIYPSKPRVAPNFSYKIYRWMYPLLKHIGTNMSVESQQLAAVMHDVGLHGGPQEIWENIDIVARYRQIS